MFFLLELAAELDLSEIHAYYRRKDPRSQKAYQQRMMVVLLLYGYSVGLPSSRRIEKSFWEDAAFWVLTGNQHPDHSRISEFRPRHLHALAKLFVQVLKVCKGAGLVSPGHVALDGTKIHANARKHRAMSHGECSGPSGSWSEKCELFCERPRSSMPRRTASPARASGAMSCQRN